VPSPAHSDSDCRRGVKGARWPPSAPPPPSSWPPPSPPPLLPLPLPPLFPDDKERSARSTGPGDASAATLATPASPALPRLARTQGDWSGWLLRRALFGDPGAGKEAAASAGRRSPSLFSMTVRTNTCILMGAPMRRGGSTGGGCK
jgi:hypothetical protein